MAEIVFHVEESPQGGFTARAVGESIFSEADSVEQLPAKIRDAVARHFADPEQRPDTAHLYFMQDGALASMCTLRLSQC